MDIPSSIPFSSIDIGSRARTQYLDIEILANDIESSGLIQPIGLVLKTSELVSDYEKEYACQLDPTKPYLLTYGGRRYFALTGLGVDTLYHGTTSDPLRPGFLLRGETPLIDQLILEIKENHNRSEMDWRDDLRLMVRAFRYAKREALESGQAFVAEAFGATLGVSRFDMYIGNKIYDHFIANPKLYDGVESMYGALSVFTGATANELSRIIIARQMEKAPTLTEVKPGTSLPNALEFRVRQEENALLPGQSPLVEKALEEIHLPITSCFLNTDAFAFMESQEPGFCDHIVTDPDYAIDKDVLNSSPHSRKKVDVGVSHKTPEESLADLYRFLPLAFRAIREKGFLVFFYALDHHEKLRDAAIATGFEVQRWPLIWSKLGFQARSNAQPNRNFPKSYECAMVCRKPGTILAKVQTQSVYTTGNVAPHRVLNHPFAKPFEIWRWIYNAISIPGQVVFDPFVGCGSSAIEAISFGLSPMGTEISSENYHNLLINLQEHYRKIFGPHVKFS